MDATATVQGGLNLAIPPYIFASNNGMHQQVDAAAGWHAIAYFTKHYCVPTA